ALQPQPSSNTRPDNSVRFIAVTPVDGRRSGPLLRTTRPGTRRPRARGGDYAEFPPGRQGQAPRFPPTPGAPTMLGYVSPRPHFVTIGPEEPRNEARCPVPSRPPDCPLALRPCPGYPDRPGRRQGPAGQTREGHQRRGG